MKVYSFSLPGSHSQLGSSLLIAAQELARGGDAVRDELVAAMRAAIEADEPELALAEALSDIGEAALGGESPGLLVIREISGKRAEQLALDSARNFPADMAAQERDHEHAMEAASLVSVGGQVVSEDLPASKILDELSAYDARLLRAAVQAVNVPGPAVLAPFVLSRRAV